MKQVKIALITSITYPKKPVSITITGSKSESNRLLVLQALFSELQIENLSGSDDTKVLKKALKRSRGTVDIHHAGTAMRFLTAYFASTPGKNITLTGSERMKQRPIGVLVDALRELGATIDYLEEEGYPPLKIKGGLLKKNEVSIQANVSSQYITALMLVGSRFPEGLTIHLRGETTSIPYIEMTQSLLNDIGIAATFSEGKIYIPHKKQIAPKVITVESDWSSASYFYSLVALLNQPISLKSYKRSSLQGDAALQELYEPLGVNSAFEESDNELLLRPNNNALAEHIMLHLADTPDIAQTIAVTCFGLGIGCTLTGLHTLKIKETDRLEALKTELSKLGAAIQVSNDSLSLKPATDRKEWVRIETYNDHRMAMAFAPLGALVPLKIQDPNVVSKSYPKFWNDMKRIGMDVAFK